MEHVTNDSNRCRCVAVFMLLAAALGACTTTSPATRGHAVRAIEPSDEAATPAPKERADPARDPCAITDAAWPAFQRDPSRRGATDVPAPTTPEIRWRQYVGIQSWLNNPVVAGDTVYTGSSGMIWNRPDGSDGVYALALGDGSVRWFAEAADDVNGLAYARCTLVVTGDEGAVWALDAADGRLLWRRAFDDRKVYTNPLLVDDKVIVGDERGYLRVLELETGRDLWQKAFGGPIRGGASSDGTRVIVTSGDATVAAFALADGSLQWTRKLKDAREIYAAPTLVDDLVIVGFVRDSTFSTPAFLALDAATGETRWVASNPEGLTGGWGNVRSSPAVLAEHLIYGEAYSNRIVSLAISDGSVAWSSPHGACFFPHWPSPAAAGHVVVVPRHDGGLYALDGATGDAIWSIYLGDSRQGYSFPSELDAAAWDRCQWDPPGGKPIFSSPAIAGDGTVLVGTGEGFFYAIGGSSSAHASSDAADASN